MRSRLTVTCLIAAAAVGVLAGAIWLRAAPRAGWSVGRTQPISRAELDARFDRAMRNVVLEWDPADPRPVADRRRALVEFTYQTYRASAWMPQSLFDRNLVLQAVAGDIETIVGDRVGLVVWRDNPDVPAFGMAPNTDGVPPLRWTVNCLVCHTAEIDGVAYFGAGTKTFDDLWLGNALKRLTAPGWRRLLAAGPADDVVAANAHRILTSHHHDKIDSLTRARSTAFAASHVELFMNGRRREGAPLDALMPPVDDVGRGDVKTPPLWHTAAKMQRGRWYTDGSFHGPFPLMASSMELEKDRSFDELIEHVIPVIREEFVSVVRHLRPPRYPYPIDEALAARGRELFYSDQIGCSRCHGTYDGQGNVDWPGVHVNVGTDPARRDVVSPGFVAAFDASPLAAEGALRPSAGYAATPLTGVWANFPYLHNGSVPTLHHLLGPVDERPAVFEVMAARLFDPVRVGQRLVVSLSAVGVDPADLLRRYGNDRNWFNTTRPGSSNAGHDFWSRIRTDENRRALIEYLKTL